MKELLSGPWSLVARIVAGVLVFSAWSGYVFLKGVHHQQEKDEVVAAQQIDAALELAAHHQVLSSEVLAKREGDQNEVAQTNPAVADVVHAGCVRAAEPRDRARVPEPAPGRSATGLRPAGPAGGAVSAYDCTADVQSARKLVVDYRALRALWHANEAAGRAQ